MTHTIEPRLTRSPDTETDAMGHLSSRHLRTMVGLDLRNLVIDLSSDEIGEDLAYGRE